MQSVLYWLEVNKLSLNVIKTHYIIFSTQNVSIPDIEIRIRNALIDRVTHTKFLGVQIDEKLSWKQHISYISKKLSKCSGILIKARKVLPAYCLRTLYHTFAYPYFTYCIHVWGKACVTYLDPLIKIQKRLIRIISCSGFRDHTEPLFRKLKILNLFGIYKYLMSTFMYKFRYKELPSIFDSMFTINSTIHIYPTRRADDYRIPPWRLQIRKRSASIQAANIWNNLSTDLKKAKSLNSFKFNLRKSIMA